MHICMPIAKSITKGLEGQKDVFFKVQKKYILFFERAVFVCLSLRVREEKVKHFAVD